MSHQPENHAGARPQAGEPADPRPGDDPRVAPQASEVALTDAVDEAWRAFRGRVEAYPAEHFGDRRGGADWSAKQMVAHVAAWHDKTTDRLARFLVAGEPVPLTETVDAINAQVARGAEGRTGGEIIRWLDDSFGRLRRLAGRLTPDHLAAHDGWARQVIAANTYEHYADHESDLRAVDD